MKAIIFISFFLISFSATADQWTQKADFPGVKRHGAFSFVIGTNGYTGCGSDTINNFLKDFWRYDCDANVWDYLLILCEQGILGLAAWLGIFVFACIPVFSPLKKEKENSKILILVLSLSGIIGFMTISFFSYPKERMYSMVMLVIMLAIPVALTNEKQTEYKTIRWIFLVLPFMCIIAAFIQYKKFKGEQHMWKAYSYQLKGNMQPMKKNVMEARSFFYPVDDTSTPLNWYLGLASYYAGEPDKAFNFYLSAIEQNPYHVQVLNDLATLYEKQGNPEQAMIYYKRAFEISPGNYRTILNLAAACYNAEKPDEAFTYLENYPDKTGLEYKTSMKAILLAKANKQVQATQDSVLADYLSRQLESDENYLIKIFEKRDMTKSFEMLLDSTSKNIFR